MNSTIGPKRERIPVMSCRFDTFDRIIGHGHNGDPTNETSAIDLALDSIMYTCEAGQLYRLYAFPLEVV